MACYHPNYCLLRRFVDSDGVLKQKIIFPKKRDIPNVEKMTWQEFCEFTKPSGLEPIQIACGKCIGCRLDKSREWATRCMLELPEHEQSWFVTLTYNDEHLPYKIQTNPLTKETRSSPTLNPVDVQLFLKRLRKRFEGTTIRFFMCGEYGSLNKRPHYHLILFGAPLNDRLTFLKKKNGDVYFSSDDVYELWTDKNGESIGYNVTTSVNWNTCAYVARYVQKKADSPIVRKDIDVVPEFIRMSRRPGIGRAYYDKFKDDIYLSDQISKGFEVPVRPPKYFDRLYDVDGHMRMLELKEKRKEYANMKPLPDTDLDEFSYRELQEKNKHILVNSRLTRDL